MKSLNSLKKLSISKISKVFVFMLAALFVAASIHAGETTGEMAGEMAVIAQGEASGTRLQAKEKSLENALRNAVEKGFGVYVDSATLTQNAALVSDDIVAQTKGFVRAYDVLEEKAEGGIYITRVRAYLSMDKIWESDSLLLLLKRMGAPRFIILSSEDINGETPKGYPALQEMEEVLVRRGFQLLKTAKADALDDSQRDIIVGDLAKALKLARQANAEIIVLLEAKCTFEKNAEIYGKEMAFFSSICQARVIQADTGEIISSAVGKASKGAVDPQEAIFDAISSSSLNASDQLIKGVLSGWAKTLNMGRAISLEIKNVSVSQLSRLTESLKTLEGVNTVSQRKYANRTALLEIKSKHKALYLAESIENLPTFKIEITGFSSSNIQLQVK